MVDTAKLRDDDDTEISDEYARSTIITTVILIPLNKKKINKILLTHYFDTVKKILSLNKKFLSIHTKKHKSVFKTFMR